jgi:hypothetical protein
MESTYANFVLFHYGTRYIDRVGKMPKKRDLDPVLARTLLTTCGDVGSVISVLDAWFDSPDPWYARQGYGLWKCFAARNRLFAQGEINPKRGTSLQQDLSRQLAVEIFLKPELRLVLPAKATGV